MLKIHTLTKVESFLSNCYLIESKGEWAVIDPSIDYLEAIRSYPELQGRLKFILLTHAHFDHIYAINSWLCEHAPVMVGADDAAALSDARVNCFLGFLGIDDGYYGEYHALSDGDTLTLGDVSIEVISTPGHTQGSVCYKIGTDIFVGDTIFANGGYGRCDLPGGDPVSIANSIFKLFAMVLVGRFYPGHGPSESVNDSIKYFI